MVVERFGAARIELAYCSFQLYNIEPSSDVFYTLASQVRLLESALSSAAERISRLQVQIRALCDLYCCLTVSPKRFFALYYIIRSFRPKVNHEVVK